MEKLTPDNQVKLQNIIQYYTEYRKTHYDDNIGIAIENKRREEEQKKIHKELQKLKDVKTTEKYVLLNNEKYNMYEKIETYEHDIDTYEDKICENEDIIELNEKIKTLEKLKTLYESIEKQQLETINTEGVNIKFLEDNNINVYLML
jgi:predicted  nucleic acid-binding Zn-ribbon protein